ncbi:MAG TPA: glycosyltransferase [Solirubrobacteraceae bacterium]|jgi:hypothetical protein|nr:glycosyltransferase [Solirubrobacteraceae bacterium]
MAPSGLAAGITGADGGVGLRGRDIVCVGFNDWDNELWTNQHHLMARLARDNRILFVESLGLRRPTAAGRDVMRMARRLRRGLAGPREVLTGYGALNVLSPLVVPWHASRLARRLNAELLPRLVARAARSLGLRRPILWAYVPQAELLVARLNPELVVYHCVDDIAAQDRVDSASFQAAEQRFVASADVVLASAPSLAERMKRLSANVHYLPNVADAGLFSQALQDGPVDAQLERLPRPRIVFTGAIAAAKLDLGLLAQLAALRPAWSIALVGPVGLGDPLTDLSALEPLSNVHLLGARPYEQLPAVLRGADAALIPYATNPLTASIFPMKVYEYLGAGLGVVSTPLPALQGVEGITIASDAASTVRALETLMAEDSVEHRRQRSELAVGHSWDSRLTEIQSIVAQAAATAAPRHQTPSPA